MTPPRQNFYLFDEFRFESGTPALFRDGKRVDATPKALEILRVLIENADEVVSKEDLMKRVWADSFVEEANLSHHIFKLRKALDENEERKLIETVPKRGYRFVGEIRDAKPAVNQAAEIAQTPKSRASRRLLALALASIALVVIAALWLMFPRKTSDAPPATVSDIRSIAVIPFTNESGNEDVAYLSDGISETLISSLSRIPTLGVKPRSAVARYKDKEVHAPTIGAELGVDAVLSGRVTQRGDDLTLFLSLIDTKTEYQIWGKQYARKISDLVTLQREIGTDVVQSLQMSITGTDQTRLAKNYSQNSESYRLYLLGNYHWNKFTGDGVRKAIEYYEKAIGLDSNYALAHAGLSNAYTVLGVNGHMPVRESRPKVKEAAERSVALDNDLAQAHLSLGAYRLFYEWDFDGAESAFRKSIELDPTYAVPHQLYAYSMRAQKRFDEMFVAIKRAYELDPLDLLIFSDLAYCYWFSGDLDYALEINKQIIEMNPNFGDIHFQHGIVLSQAGQHDAALAEIMQALALTGNATRIKSGLGIVHGRSGNKANAQKVINELLAESGKRYVSPLDIALIYASMDDPDNAFEWLEKAYEERSCWLFELNVDPNWDPIRDDPRFRDLVGRVGLSN